MKLNMFMSIVAVVGFLFGLAFLLFPVPTMSIYGVALDASGEYVSRYLGSAFIGVGVVAWFARYASPKGTGMRAIILGNFILTLTGFVTSLFDVFYGVGNNMVWSTVVIYFLLALGFGYFQFRNPAD